MDVLSDMSLGDALRLTVLITTAVTGSVGVVALVRRVYLRTVGRRRALINRLQMLAPTMQLDYFVDVLGEPQQRRTHDEGQTATWVFHDAYCQAVGRVDGSVLRWSVTTRSRRFRPTFMRGHTISGHGDSIEVSLGRTRFADLPHSPTAVAGDLGARRFSYRESFDFGNPGNYQRYVFALNDAGWVNDHRLISLVNDRNDQEPMGGGEAEDWITDPKVDAARRSTAINTVSVGAPFELSSDRREGEVPYVGPDWDLVRVIPDRQWSSRWRAWLRSVRTRMRRVRERRSQT